MKKFFKRNTNTGERDRKKKEEEVSSSLQKNHEQDSSSTTILHNGQKKASERLLLDPRGMMMKRKTTTTTTIATTKSSSSSPPIILDANVVMVTPASSASKAETKQHFMADYTIESQRNLTLSNNSNSSSSSPSDNDKLIKQRLKEERMQQEERMQYLKKISEGSNNSNNSYYNGQLPLSQRGLSREEQDKLTKEIIKQQRAAAAAAASSLSSSVSYASSTITVGHRSTPPAAAQEEASIEESSHSISSSNTSSSSSSSSSSDDSDKGSISFSWRSNTDLMSSSLKSNDNNKNDDDDEQLLDVSSSDGMMMKKEGSGRSIKSVLKGKQRYTSGDRGDGDGDGKKNLDGGREESWKSVSFAKNLHIDDDDDDEGRRSSSRVSYDLAKDDDDDDGEDGNKARPKVDDLNESDFNIDDWNDAIMASAREFDGPDHHYDEYDNEELRRSNLIDLHIAQFMATSQISGSLDFDPSELKEIYRNSIDGVQEGEEDDDVDEEQQMYRDASRRQLAHFEEEEFKKNMRRRMSQRLSKTSLRIAAWHQKHSLRMAMKVATRTPAMEWLSSFYRCDPRWQIQAFFDEVAREGGDAQLSEDLAASPLALLFNKANVFTVWRPTSDEAIKNMMLGIATGKGLDIKGKSAKRGNISSYVPFIQIYEEEHKAHVRELLKDGRTIRVFYQSEASRDEAHGMISDMKEFMLFAAEDAMRILSDEFADEAEQELAMKHLMYDDSNVRVTLVDTYVESDTPVFGLDITERLFWESYVMMQDCSRSEGTEWDIGRKSEPTFMDFNFKSLRKDPGPDAPRAVVYQFSKDSPMEPRTLLMAYEEHGMVKPVVSDFDCFLLGSRGVKYSQQIPPNQVELVKWSVTNISEVLDERAATQSDSGWMSNWFQVLKKAAMRNYVPITPKYGNGDPKSYEIIEIAVSRLKGTGCVRHGAECFNWYFPQEIDDEFLVISDTLPGNVKWKKMNVFELQECLMTKIDEGFTFPINPKWVLCDPGWRRVYDKLLASQKPNVQDSINCWLPPETGLREQIDAISKRHPHGFEGRVYKVEGTEVMDKMEEELERYRRVQALWRKARALVWWIVFLHTKSQMKRLEAFQQRR